MAVADDVRRVRRRVVTDGLAISFSAFDLGVAVVVLVALVRDLGLAA